MILFFEFILFLAYETVARLIYKMYTTRQALIAVCMNLFNMRILNS